MTTRRLDVLFERETLGFILHPNEDLPPGNPSANGHFTFVFIAREFLFEPGSPQTRPPFPVPFSLTKAGAIFFMFLACYDFRL